MAFSESAFGMGTGPIFLDGVMCDGTEQTLSACPRVDFGIPFCDHTQDAGVLCINGIVQF